MQAQCLALEYRDAIREVVQSFSRQDPGGVYRLFPMYASIIDRGNGWAYVNAPSELVLTVEINGDEHELWVGRFFKERLGRLTAKRRERLRATMPTSLQVDERVSRKGNVYYVPTQSALASWLEQAFAPESV